MSTGGAFAPAFSTSSCGTKLRSRNVHSSSSMRRASSAAAGENEHALRTRHRPFRRAGTPAAGAHGGQLPRARRIRLAPSAIGPAAGHARGRARAGSPPAGPPGRPVLPFCAPPSQAMPAMSRCAQCRPCVNFARKHAAVIAPPSRPQALAKSAKLLLQLLAVFLGQRHVPAAIVARTPAAVSCAASSSSLRHEAPKCAPSATTQAPVSVAMSTTAAGLKRRA